MLETNLDTHAHTDVHTPCPWHCCWNTIPYLIHSSTKIGHKCNTQETAISHDLKMMENLIPPIRAEIVSNIWKNCLEVLIRWCSRHMWALFWAKARTDCCLKNFYQSSQLSVICTKQRQLLPYTGRDIRSHRFQWLFVLSFFLPYSALHYKLAV